MRLRDIMTSPVEAITPRASCSEAWNRMRLIGAHHLAVLDGKRLVGVVSERDVGGRRRAADGRPVDEVMARSVVTAAPNTTVRQAANLMRGRVIGCLPVLEGERVIGIVTLSDLLDLLGRGQERPVSRGKRYTLRHRRSTVSTPRVQDRR